MTSNSKLKGSRIVDCRPQVGPCRMKCNQCYYNLFPLDGFETPRIPDPEETNRKGLIVRMNAEHDSGIEKPLVLETARPYNDLFYNTATHDMDFPRPVVVTINHQEYSPSLTNPDRRYLDRVMFARVRLSPGCFERATIAASRWMAAAIPIMITPMAFYSLVALEEDKERASFDSRLDGMEYKFKKRHVHECWQLDQKSLRNLVHLFIYQMCDHSKGSNGCIYLCGTYESLQCEDCNLCEHFYYAAKARMAL